MKNERREREAFYRSMKREERRPLSLRARLAPQLRSTDDGPVIAGYATIYGVPYTMTDWLGEYDEVVAPGAASKTLAEEPDVRYLVNHEGVPLGRTAAGTLELHEDDTGLWYETSALDQRNPKALEICSALERGDVAESSFAFRVIRQSWSPDYMQRTIEEFSLQDGDVSSVTYPANPNTSSGLRAAELVEQLAVADLGELVGAARDRSELTGVIDAARTRLDELLVELRGDRGESPSPTLPLGRRRISLGERPVTAR